MTSDLREVRVVGGGIADDQRVTVPFINDRPPSPIYNKQQHVSGNILAYTEYEAEEAPTEPSTFIYKYKREVAEPPAFFTGLS